MRRDARAGSGGGVPAAVRRAGRIALVVASVGPACAARGQVRAGDGVTDIVLLHAAPASGLTTPTERVVRNHEDWIALWPRVAGPLTPTPPPPAVDFATHVVVVVGIGTRSSGGYGVAFDLPEVVGDTAVVRYVVRSPGASCLTSSMITSPVIAGALAETVRPVRFLRRDEVAECDP